MRYAFISDIHGNLPALEAVLADIQSRGNIDATYHLGDLVGYAPWPNEVVSLIRSMGISGVAGNYDSTTATDYKHCGCRYENATQEVLSHASYEWTRAHITPETKSVLRGLPFRIDIRPLGGHHAGPTVVLLHGNQTLNTVYVTEDRPDSFLAKMGAGVGARAGDVVCFGHTHKPWHRIVEGVHFLNVGSAGRPKDGDWRAGYVVLGVGSDGEIETAFARVAYDVECAMAGIRSSDLPDDFAEYLRNGGMEPSSSAH